MSRQIRAAVMYDFNMPLVIETVTLKEPSADQITVQIAASGVCHSDLSVWRGRLPYPPPVVLGHEGAGIVEEVGSHVTNVKVGDHVVLSWVPSCGHCQYCLDGTTHLCDSGLQAAMEMRDMGFVNHEGQDVARFGGLGSFAEKTVIQATAAVKIPDDVPLARACLIGCAVMTGVGAAINTVHIHPGQTVAVFGCGGVGLNVIQGAALAGAGRILAVDVSPGKLERAIRFGATDTIDARGVDETSEEVRSRTGGAGVDFAFEVVGVPEVMRQAFLSTRRGGKAVIVGVAGFGVDVNIPACMLSLDERSLIGSLYGSANMTRDVPRMLELHRRGKLKLDELVSRELPLSDVNDALLEMEGGNGVRSVIRFD